MKMSRWPPLAGFSVLGERDRGALATERSRQASVLGQVKRSRLPPAPSRRARTSSEPKDHVDHATGIALVAHEGQVDKIGHPYFELCRRVAEAVQGNEAKVVAYLHDVVEKGRGWTIDRLKEEGFPPEIIVAVDTMTHRDGEAWEDFVRRAGTNSLARPVKQADLEDNLAQVQTLGEDGTKYADGLVLLNMLRTS